MIKGVKLLIIPWYLCLISLTTLPAYAATHSFLQPLGPIAHEQLFHLYWVVGLCLIAVLPVIIATPWILWRYRYLNPKATYTPHWTYNRKLEIVLWGGPSAIVLALSVLLWNATTKLDPYKPLDTAKTPLCVDVIGLNWKWVFIYPQYNRATVDTLIIPTNTPVSLRLTSDTVMQSFRISALAGQIYAMPGMQTRLHFIANQAGEAIGENTQFSGKDFARQQFSLSSVSDDDWQKWLSGKQISSMTAESYHQLAQSGLAEEFSPALAKTGLQAPVFSLQDPALFDRVVKRYHQGKPVRGTEQPGAKQFDAKHATLPNITGHTSCSEGRPE
ncbi:hypothetical protein [Neptunicella sp. SCSIO 80796]|uniref:hypothetical protein n=1 Tax=Neptunicella plasticusilytica TaxID=3117012 RepID=UPI003A4D7383